MVKPMNPAPAQPAEWTKLDTMAYLTANPLPTDFTWRRSDGRKDADNRGALAAVQPTYAVADYGKWLHDTPYYQGLFELIHDLLFNAPRLPEIHDLARQLTAIRAEREGQQKLF